MSDTTPGKIIRELSKQLLTGARLEAAGMIMHEMQGCHAYTMGCANKVNPDETPAYNTMHAKMHVKSARYTTFDGLLSTLTSWNMDEADKMDLSLRRDSLSRYAS